jgi:polyhydroxyalkanoate synthesis regulator phasin
MNQQEQNLLNLTSEAVRELTARVEQLERQIAELKEKHDRR